MWLVEAYASGGQTRVYRPICLLLTLPNKVYWNTITLTVCMLSVVAVVTQPDKVGSYKWDQMVLLLHIHSLSGRSAYPPTSIKI